MEEEVAIRAGILLTDHDAFELLNGTPLEPWAARLDGDDSEVIGIRPEFLEDLIRVLRAEIGNIPDATRPSLKMFKTVLELIEKEDQALMPIIQAVQDEICSERNLMGQELCQIVKQKTGASARLAKAVVLFLTDHSESYTIFRRGQISKKWDGIVPLSDLFRADTVPTSPDCYLDQRFVDYIAARPQDLAKLHWRNFERLTAEYFNRQAYEVALGPGRKDGGVDVRVWPKGDSDGPPLMLIQCKRYHKSNLVQVEHVKALWTDVTFEEAQRGLIATTSRITPQGKRIATARKYPLDFAEAEQVSEWATSMWRLAWRGKGKTEGVGEYLLAPFYPIRPGDLDFLDKSKAPEGDDT